MAEAKYPQPLSAARVLIAAESGERMTRMYQALSLQGAAVTLAPSGGGALRQAQEQWNLVILGLELSDVPALGVLDFLVQRQDQPPILILASEEDLSEKIALFDRGCDDYLAEPFALEELLARAKALLRRSPRVWPDSLHYEDLSLDPASLRLIAGSNEILLTPKESAICRALLRAPGQVISRQELLHSVWGLSHEPKTNFIEVHLANLRRKLHQIGRQDWLQTVRLSGFFLQRPAHA
jgi:DNA-binding response OmpR family regulator